MIRRVALLAGAATVLVVQAPIVCANSSGPAPPIDAAHLPAAGRFASSRSVDGTFVNGGEGCGQTTWIASRE